MPALPIARHIQESYNKLTMGLKPKTSPPRNRLSVAVVLSYVLDWVVLIIVAAIGTAVGTIRPFDRPFSLDDVSISFPHHADTVSTAVLIVVSLLAPAVIILLISLLLVPGPTVPSGVPKNLVWRRKLWEWQIGWLGLAMSCAFAWFITSGIKNLAGKPRPDLLMRCNPDRSRISEFTVGYTNLDVSPLVSSGICRPAAGTDLDDGFRSFPSGHSSFSAAGLVYLSLFLAAKLAINIPTLAPRAYRRNNTHYHSAFPSGSTNTPEPHSRSSDAGQQSLNPFTSEPGLDTETIAARSEAAAPPLYLLVLAAIPFCASIYICVSRWYDFRHHGFDILSGFFIGTVTAVFAFRYYHLPLSNGAGWAWGPRSRERAFWAGVGTGTYTGGAPGEESATLDVENGHANGNGEAGAGVSLK